MGAIISQSNLPISAVGKNLVIHEWSGSGPGFMHVHFEDDECWHILEGSLTFRFPEGEVIATAGKTVFVPAGTPHDYFETDGPCRYLIIMTPRLDELIKECMRTPFAQLPELFVQYASEVLNDDSQGMSV